MKITINKDASNQRFNEIVDKIVRQAKSTAHMGNDTVYYPVIRNELFTTHDVSEAVETITEDTVYKSRISNGDIVFRIR